MQQVILMFDDEAPPRALSNAINGAKSWVVGADPDCRFQVRFEDVDPEDEGDVRAGVAGL
jgi:hypothetical protein